MGKNEVRKSITEKTVRREWDQTTKTKYELTPIEKRVT